MRKEQGWFPISSPRVLPAVAPYYPRPPFLYRDCPFLVVTFRTTANAIRRVVPQPLEPNADDLMVLLIGRQHNDRLGPYAEAILGAPCTLGERTGNYAVVLYLDETVCIVPGREVWGWPKKDANFHLHADPARASATTVRGGVEIIRTEVELARPAGPEDLALDPTWFNLKLIPSVTDGAPPDVMQLTETTLANVGVRGRRASGPTVLGLANTIEDPLASLMPVREVVGGISLRLDFDLLDGVVVHDYLTSGGLADGVREPAARWRSAGRRRAPLPRPGRAFSRGDAWQTATVQGPAGGAASGRMTETRSSVARTPRPRPGGSGVLRTRLLPPRAPPECLPRADLVERVLGAFGAALSPWSPDPATARPPCWPRCCRAWPSRGSGSPATSASAAPGRSSPTWRPASERFPGVASAVDLSGRPEEAVTALANEILTTIPDDFVLVLDDVHELSPAGRRPKRWRSSSPIFRRPHTSPWPAAARSPYR